LSPGEEVLFFTVLGGSGCGFSATLSAGEVDPFRAPGGRGCGLSSTLLAGEVVPLVLTADFFFAADWLVVVLPVLVVEPVVPCPYDKLAASRNVKASVNGFFIRSPCVWEVVRARAILPQAGL
jgi:hypothetical protein